jgi:hypothetical protein
MLGAAVAFALVVGLLAAAGRSWAAPVMAVAVLALGAYYIRAQDLQSGLVALLIVTSTVDHFTFAVGPLALRPEQVAAFVALTALAATRLRERDVSWLRPSLSELLLIAWLLVGIVSSLLASPDKRLSAKILALIAICSLGFFLPRRLLAGAGSAGRLQVVTLWLLLVFASESAYGSLAYLLHVFGPTIGLTPNPASGHLSAYGTLWEQNVFGSFAGAGAVAWVYLGPSRVRWAALGIAACAGGLFDSLTRAAWLAAGVVGALGIVVAGLRRRIDLRQTVIGGLGGLVVVVATLVVDRLGHYNLRLAPGSAGGPGNLITSILNLVDLAGRANQIGPVWTDISGHLVIGRGIASYEALHVIGGVPQHVASLPLLVLNDTGIIGLLLFGGFVLAVTVRAWSMRTNLLVLGFGQVAIVVALTNLATETTELMIDWLLIGILMAACDGAFASPAARSPNEAEVGPT